LFLNLYDLCMVNKKTALFWLIRRLKNC
jgi:hypothetical protein